MPLYCYKNPKNNKIIEVIRPMSQSSEPLILDDGTICPRDINAEHLPNKKQHRGKNHKEAEIWDVDADYLKKANPKTVKTRNGTILPRKEYHKYL